VVVVRVRQDDRVEAPVPGGTYRSRTLRRALAVGPAVDQDSPPGRPRAGSRRPGRRRGRSRGPSRRAATRPRSRRGDDEAGRDEDSEVLWAARSAAGRVVTPRHRFACAAAARRVADGSQRRPRPKRPLRPSRSPGRPASRSRRDRSRQVHDPDQPRQNSAHAGRRAARTTSPGRRAFPASRP
jgi:hypothetical protein